MLTNSEEKHRLSNDTIANQKEISSKEATAWINAKYAAPRIKSTEYKE